MTRTIEKIKEELIAKSNENFNEIQKCETNLEAIEPTIRTAKENIIKAKKEVDAEAYSKAKTELWTAENTKEMLVEKLQELHNTPLVTKVEYRTFYNEIINATELKNEELLEKISSVIPELEQLSKEYYKAVEEANATLRVLEDKIGKNSEDFKKDENGRIVSEFFSGLSYSPSISVAGFVDRFINGYKELKK